MNDRHNDPDEAAFDRECRRVGVTWNTFLEWDRLNAGGGPPSPDGTIGLEGGLRALIALLRPLPDGVGDAGFLAEMERQGQYWRARAEEASRRTEARDRGRRPGPPRRGT